METAIAVGLSKEDVSYLRRASDIYAIHFGGQNYIRCVKRGQWGDAFGEDKRVDIPVEGNGADGHFTAVWEFPWATLRTGDQVSFYWYPDANTNQYLRDAGLHADALYVDITRGKSTHRYLADVSICENNSARMCKHDRNVG